MQNGTYITLNAYKCQKKIPEYAQNDIKLMLNVHLWSFVAVQSYVFSVNLIIRTETKSIDESPIFNITNFWELKN